MRPEALVFDVDGTLAETEEVHRRAFNETFAAFGLDWSWSPEDYRVLLRTTGGKERMLVHAARLGVVLDDDLVRRIHRVKTERYGELLARREISLRPGIAALIADARRCGVKLAIATTTSPVNIAALLRTAIGPDWSSYFAVIEDASTAPLKKPHPQVYRQTLQRLGLPAAQCLAFEDSANGLQAARGAGLATIVTPNDFTAHHDVTGALRVLPSLAGVSVAQLRNWHAQARR